MHLTAASWFDFEVEAKPYTFSGGRIGLLPVILLCCAFWGRCPLSPCSKPGRGCCPESPIYRGHPELRELLSLLRVQNGERTSPGPSPASRSPRPFSGGCPPPPPPRLGAMRSKRTLTRQPSTQECTWLGASCRL